VEDALAHALGHSVRVTAGGRTDAGVHAEGQTVTFDTTSSVPPEALPRLLPRWLPDDIWPVQAQEVATDFDARRSAVRRWYRYALWRAGRVPLSWRGRCLEHADSLDVQAMRHAAWSLVGSLDLRSLVDGWGRDAWQGRSTVRTIYAADWLGTNEQPLLELEICADGFMRHVVRTLVGGMLRVGRGLWSVDDLLRVIALGDRRAGGPTAPAHGLTLTRIEYTASLSENARGDAGRVPLAA
jgi:tRNA pseudouridine38-40 synthase